jgi:hypothetical protein
MKRRVLLLPLLAALACAGDPGVPVELLAEDAATQERTPLGGDALSQRRGELQRAQRDMLHFQATLESLQQRKDRNGAILFSGFVDAYMGTHLDPLLRNEWQSRHPELAAMDATLRLVKAELLMHMRETRRMQQELDELARRFEGRADMLVEYPAGQQVTLQKALELLRGRKWRG